MLAVSNYFLKQQDSFNISVFIFYIFKWFYAFSKNEMSYEECVCRMMMMMMQKNSNSTFCDEHIIIIIIIIINNNKFMVQFRARKIYMFVTEY